MEKQLIMNRYDKILEKYIPIIEESELYEGLIYTYNIFSTVWKLNQHYSSNNIIFEQFENENRFYLYIKNGIIDYNTLNNIIQTAENVLGWIPSYYKKQNEKSNNFINNKEFFEKMNKNESYLLVFDAKFDIEIDQKHFKSNYAYHATPSIKNDKILKIGLAPKSNNKMANHNYRIYLTFTLDGIRELLKDKNFTKDNKKFTIFKIDIKHLLEKRQIRFFRDSAYIKDGLYTYENIPPQFITIEKEIIIE